MRLRRLLSATLSAALLPMPALSAQQADLFSQSASAQLMRQFGGGNVSWMLLDQSGRILSENWSDPGIPVAPGSLLKPFIAVAYGEQNGASFPRVTCRGTQSRCWLPKGHGRIGLEAAIAGSCNTYFRSLGNSLDLRRAQLVLARFGLKGPPDGATADALIGLTGLWRELPVDVARAYLKLATDPSDSTLQLIRAGMRDAAQSGTARDVDLALGSRAGLAKTGTAPCLHHPRAAGDGFAIVLYPAVQPRLVLLVCMHGTTGAHAAGQAGAMLRTIAQGEP